MLSLGRIFLIACMAMSFGVLMHGSSWAAGTCNGRPCISISSFNIKLLGGGGSADSNRDMDKIVERIKRHDVIVLQEINKNSAAWSTLRTRLQQHNFSVVAAGDFGGANPGRQQFVMILINQDNVEAVSGTAHELSIPTTNPELWTKCSYNSLRPPVSVKLKSGSFDFRLVGVHLKSQVTVSAVSGDLRQVCDDDIRNWQASQMANELLANDGGNQENDVIIVGDFNSPFSAEEFLPLRSAGFKAMIRERCDVSNQKGCTHVVSSSSNYKPGVLDNILVSEGLVEVVVGSGEIDKLGTSISNYRKRQSDHLPIWAKFYIDQD